MANYQLNLLSSHGDETLAGLRYVVCGLSDHQQAAAIIGQGFSAPEGHAAVSTNLTYALRQAGSNNDGCILVVHKPAQPYLGYASFTTAIVDRAAHTVSGNPLGYAAGRNKLGWYAHPDTDASHERIQTTDPLHHPSLIIPGGYMVGWLAATPALAAVLNRLEVAVKAFTATDLATTERGIAEALTFSDNFTQVSTTELTHSLVLATIEAIVITHLRLLRLQSLALLGYQFSEGGVATVIQAPASAADLQTELTRMEQVVNGPSSLLTAELTWLRPHVATTIATIRTELSDGLPAAVK